MLVIADTFQKALARLTAPEQAAVKQAAFEFQFESEHIGIRLRGAIPDAR